MTNYVYILVHKHYEDFWIFITLEKALEKKQLMEDMEEEETGYIIIKPLKI